MSNSKLPSQVVIKGQIADASGHTDFEGNIEDAMKTITEQVASAGKWVYVNGSPFIPKGNITDGVEQDALRNALLDDENPNFVLTGKLQGGAVVRNRNLKTPVSSFFNTKSRPQMAIVFKQNHGKTFVDVVASDYKGSRTKLAEYKEQILSAVHNALSTAPKASKTKAISKK